LINSKDADFKAHLRGKQNDLKVWDSREIKGKCKGRFAIRATIRLANQDGFSDMLDKLSLPSI